MTQRGEAAGRELVDARVGLCCLHLCLPHAGGCLLPGLSGLASLACLPACLTLLNELIHRLFRELNQIMEGGVVALNIFCTTTICARVYSSSSKGGRAHHTA